MGDFMSIKQFIDEWEQSNDDIELAQIKEYWEIRADEFNNSKKSNYEEIVRLLDEVGIIDNSYNILDIGCGPGKLSLKIASKVNSITGIDISENMIHHARRNAKEKKIDNVHFKVASWEEIELKNEGWEKKFDVVIASMTPGIKDLKTLKKMIEGSKRYCILSSYVHRRDLRNEIEEYIGEKKKDDSNSKIYYVFNILWNLGYFPEIRYKDIDITNEYTYDKALEIYGVQFSAEGEKKKKIEEFLKMKTNKEGMVVQKYQAKIAWMLWKV